MMELSYVVTGFRRLSNALASWPGSSSRGIESSSDEPALSSATAVYSATKAALHSYTMSLRYKLRGTPVKVLEIAPPWVQTDLLGSNNEPRAMPLSEFIEETIRVLGTDAEEVLVERAKPLRNNAGPNERALVVQFNDMMASPK